MVSVTDTSNNIVAQYHFDPWGNQISYSGTLSQPIRYAGYYFDEETGLYYLKSRYYSPALGRFLTRDSIKYTNKLDPQTLNLYSYCGNNPISHTDPNGNWKNEAEEKYAKAHWGKYYDKMVSYSKSWEAAHAAGNTTMERFYNGKANEIRAKHNSSAFYPWLSRKNSSSSSSSIPSQIWAGMTCEGWTPYIQTGTAVVTSTGVGAITPELAVGQLTVGVGVSAWQNDWSSTATRGISPSTASTVETVFDWVSKVK